MKFNRTYTLGEIAHVIDAKAIGNTDFPVLGMNEIHRVEAGDIVFVDHPKYYDKALESAATIVLINKEVECPEGKALLISEDPFRDFNKLTKHFHPFIPASSAVSKTAFIGEGSIIQPNVFIGNNVHIGKDCIIYPNVSIYDNTIIGDRVIIQANTVIGSNGFYYKKRPEGYDQLLSGGRVVIESDVHIGASCTIDKGVTSDTRIGKGSKLDNQVHIGHDTIVGENFLCASQAGIAGCVIIGDNVTMWGQVGVSSGIEIGDNAVLNGQSGITKSVKPGDILFGTPARNYREKLKEFAAIQRIPDIIKKLKELE